MNRDSLLLEIATLYAQIEKELMKLRNQIDLMKIKKLCSEIVDVIEAQDSEKKPMKKHMAKRERILHGKKTMKNRKRKFMTKRERTAYAGR